MQPKICLSEDQLAFLGFFIHELMNKNLNLQNNLGLMFAQKYPKGPFRTKEGNNYTEF
jgi:hypothetical protein